MNMSKNVEDIGQPASLVDVLVIHLVIALASPVDCVCAHLFACVAPAGYSLSVEAWYTIGRVPVLPYLLAWLFFFSFF